MKCASCGGALRLSWEEVHECWLYDLELSDEEWWDGYSIEDEYIHRDASDYIRDHGFMVECENGCENTGMTIEYGMLRKA